MLVSGLVENCPILGTDLTVSEETQGLPVRTGLGAIPGGESYEFRIVKDAKHVQAAKGRVVPPPRGKPGPRAKGNAYGKTIPRERVRFQVFEA
jgi:hypothetical protein